AFIIVGAAGLVSASLRLDGAERRATPYGTILLVETAALVALGAIRAVHRRRPIRRLPDGLAFARRIGARLSLAAGASPMRRAPAARPGARRQDPGGDPHGLAAAARAVGVALPRRPTGARPPVARDLRRARRRLPRRRASATPPRRPLAAVAHGLVAARTARA